MILLGLLFLGIGIYGLLVERFQLYCEMYISFIFSALIVFTMVSGSSATSVGLVVVLVMTMVSSLFSIFYKRTQSKSKSSIEEFQLR